MMLSNMVRRVEHSMLPLQWQSGQLWRTRDWNCGQWRGTPSYHSCRPSRPWIPFQTEIIPRHKRSKWDGFAPTETRLDESEVAGDGFFQHELALSKLPGLSRLGRDLHFQGAAGRVSAVLYGEAALLNDGSEGRAREERRNTGTYNKDWPLIVIQKAMLKNLQRAISLQVCPEKWIRI